MHTLALSFRQLGIADLIGDGSKTVCELAKANDVLDENLYRILRCTYAHTAHAAHAHAHARG
jgi:hypothetical protein